MEDPKWPEGFEATINNARIYEGSTGGLYPGVGNDLFITQFKRVSFGEWFNLEVIADGSLFAVLVNGKRSADHFERNSHFPKGHIALQQYTSETEIEFRDIEIKELNRPGQKDAKELRKFPETGGRVIRVAFSPDGLRILSGASQFEHREKTGGRWFFSDFGSPLRLWDVTTGQELLAKNGGGQRAEAVALSFDGRYVASSAHEWEEPPMLIWSVNDKKNINKFLPKYSSKDVISNNISFSSDDHRVMAALANGTVLVWDLEKGKEHPAITLKTTGPIKQDEFPCAMFSSDRKRLVTGSRIGPVELWELESGKKLQTFTGHVGAVRGVDCSTDGRLILSRGIDNTVRLWDVATGKKLKQLSGADRDVLGIALSPDGRRALTGDVDGLVRLWDFATDKESCRMEGHTMAVNCVAFSPDGRKAVSGSDDRTVRLWQLPE